MTTTLCKPGLRAPRSPFTPIGHVGGTPVYPLSGARRGGAVEMVVDDSDEDDDPFDGDDEDDDGDDEPDLRGEFTRTLNRRTRDEGDEDDEDDDDEPEEPRQRPRQRGRKADEQDAEADDTGEADEGDEGAGDGEDDDWTPPTREQVSKMERQLKKNNTEAWKTRHVRKIMNKLGVTDDAEFNDWLLERGIDPDNGDILPGVRQVVDADGDQETLTRDQLLVQRRRDEERGATRAAAQYKPAVIQFAVAAALREAEFSGRNMDIAMRLIDQDQIDLEFQEGELVVWGVDDQIAALKNDFPELFKKAEPEKTPQPPRRREGGRTPAGRRDNQAAAALEPRRRRGVVEVDGGDRGRRGARRPETWLQRIDRQITGNR